MKRVNVWHIILEVIVILGNIVVGMTLLTYVFQHASIIKMFVGSMMISIAGIQICDYFTMKFAIRRLSVQRLIFALVYAALGIVLIVLKIDIDLVCIIFGASNIANALVNLISSSTNLSRQPLLNSANIVIHICTIVFSIFIIVNMTGFLVGYVTFLGIVTLIVAFLQVIEFIIHRYQNQ